MPLNTTLQAPPLISNPPHCLLGQSMHQQAVYEDLLGDSVKFLAEIKVNKSTALLIFTTSLLKFLRLVSHGFP